MDHGLDYFQVLNENNNFNIEKNLDLFEDVSVIVAALVSGYARVHMLQIMQDIHHARYRKAMVRAGGSVYYTDTDSIVTDYPLHEHTPDMVGSELGQFKLEYEIKEAYFISNKTYCLVLNNGDIVIKCKGVNKDSLSLEDFKAMYLSSLA